MVKMQINGRHRDLPSSWNDLNEEQFKRVCFVRAQHIHNENQQAVNASRMVLFHILSGLKTYIIEEITAIQWADILPHMNFIFDTPTLDHNPLPKVYVAGLGDLYGPEGMLDYSSFDEMISADKQFTTINTTEDEEQRYTLFAKLFFILYRPEHEHLAEFRKDPKRWNGDIREHFNSEIINERVKLYRGNVEFYKLVAAFIYYWSFRSNKLVAGFPNYFKEPDGDNEDRTGNDYGWADPLFEMSGDKFGTFEQTANQHWYTIMAEISRQIDKANARK